MTISLNQIGKKYGTEWIFQNLSATLNSSNKWAITGPNGSGKSTLLKVISGHLSPNKGKVIFEGDLYQNVSFCAPYIDIIDAFTPHEMLNFQRTFIPFQENFSNHKILEILELKFSTSKRIQDFSSGMKQRLKLGLSLLSEKKIILLDEPTTNLDIPSKAWYKFMIEEFTKSKLLVIASNEENDYAFCNHFIHIPDFKPKSVIQKFVQ